MAEGFMLHDRLLRPAQVGVSTPKSADGPADQSLSLIAFSS
jgi:hypothetical protein